MAKYQLNISRPIFLSSQSIEGRLKWIISYNISLQELMSANWLWTYWPRFFRRSAWIFCMGKVWTYLLKEICYEFLGMYQERNDKDLKMIRCWPTRILNPEHNLSNLFLCLFYRISLTWINPKLNWGLMSGIYPAVWPGLSYNPAGTW